MATMNGLNGDTDLKEASTPKHCEEPERGCGMNADSQNSDMHKGNEKTNTVPFFKMFAFADQTDIFLMIAGTIGAIGNGLTMPLMTIFFGDLTDSFGENQNNNEVVDAVSEVALKFVYLGVGAAMAGFLQVTCWMVTGERQAARIRSLYLQTILRQDVFFFDVETNTGVVVGRMSGDTVLIQDAMGEKVGKFLRSVASFIGGFIVAFIKGWLLTLVMLSSLPLLVIAGGAISLIVASFTGEKQAISNYNKFLVSAYRSGVYQGSVSGLGLGMVMLIMFCSYALAIWYGGRMILEKGYTEVVSVIVAIMTGSMSLGQASPCMNAFASGQAAAFKMFETIRRKPEVDAYDTKGKMLEDIRGDIELRDVYFSYPARPEEQIFSGFSLFIPSGTTAALVGHSGSGKSTVISLIERFYDPQAGEVLIDGINLKEFQLKWMRGKIGLVSQEPVLFTSSIRYNIAYGKEGATSEEIRAAAELANAAKFIDKLPQGLDTLVGEHGTQLSGGQKQRVAIARAILKDPRILLLDEATSALDAESERTVQEALDRIMVNRTTAIVAHRLSTVRNADMIAVIHQGKMVEKGSHSDLVRDPDGASSQLICLQEVNKELKQMPDEEKGSDISEKSFTQSSLRISLKKTISRGSFEAGSSSRRSFSVSSGLPTGQNVTDSVVEDAAASHTMQSGQASEVSIHRLASLNKLEIPVLLLGTLASIINGFILPIYALLLSEAIKTFYKPPNELTTDSRFWALIFMALGMASLLAYPAEAHLFSVAGCKLIQRLR
ncbi:hypothetical protein PTKIN_Ptkin15bG0076000 [Pterospermum kingtungense]